MDFSKTGRAMTWAEGFFSKKAEGCNNFSGEAPPEGRLEQSEVLAAREEEGLRYELTKAAFRSEDGSCYWGYGLRAILPEAGEQAEIKDISCCRQMVERMLDRFLAGRVFPSVLRETAQEYISGLMAGPV